MCEMSVTTWLKTSQSHVMASLQSTHPARIQLQPVELRERPINGRDECNGFSTRSTFEKGKSIGLIHNLHTPPPSSKLDDEMRCPLLTTGLIFQLDHCFLSATIIRLANSISWRQDVAFTAIRYNKAAVHSNS